jgi:signal transduction histidine kinase
MAQSYYVRAIPSRRPTSTSGGSDILAAPVSVATLLKAVPFFQDLDDAQLAEVAAAGRRAPWAAGSQVFSEGDRGDGLYLVLDGRVRVHRHDRVGDEIDLAILGRGELFGEVALLDGAPRSASVTALEATELFFLGRAEFLLLLRRWPKLHDALLVALGGRLRQVQEKVYWEAIEKQALRVELERERYRSLAQMVAGLAHEINTPIGTANTAASFLAERLTADGGIAAIARDDDARLALEDAVESAKLIQGNLARASKLVTSFKNVAVGQLSETLERCDLGALVREVLALHVPQARAARVEVRVDDALAPGAREWLGYPGYLTQVLLNLLTNAERYAYAPGDGGRVDVVLRADDRARPPGFILSVRDFGRGIPKKDLARVFEPFFTTGRERGGTGLGLTIVQSLVRDALRGTIEVRSEEGKGTEVVVALPRTTPDAHAEGA